MTKIIRYGLTFLLGMLLLSGCTTIEKTAAVIMDPDIQVGEKEGAASTVSFSFFAEPLVNENILGEGTPIDFQVIFLKDDSKMLSADFDQLVFELEGSLGKNYLSHDDYSLIPNQYKYIEAIPVTAGTRYIGLVARYAEPNLTQWKKIVRIKSTGRHYNFLLQFRRANADFIKEDY